MAGSARDGSDLAHELEGVREQQRASSTDLEYLCVGLGGAVRLAELRDAS
jgi:hypothetical protein